MISSKDVRTITDMRKDADGLLRLVARYKKPIGIFKNNRLKAYLVDAETLESLETFVEDFLDRKLVSERLTKAKDNDFGDFEKFWKKYRLPR